MAHILKSPKSACSNLLNHYERKEGIKFSNQEIDNTKSHLNYNLASENNLTQQQILNQRLSEVKVLKRKDVNVMCSWVITLPKTVEKDSLEEDYFFKETYDFLENKYGKNNVISAYVHKDEKTPHMHFAFIPVVIDKKTGIEKVSAKELITKNHLQSFHKELDAHLSSRLNKEIGILNGATIGGNKTVLELKNSKLEKQIKIRETKLEKLKTYKNIHKKFENLKISESKSILKKSNSVKIEDMTIKEFKKMINGIFKEMNNNINGTILANILKQENEKLKEEMKDLYNDNVKLYRANKEKNKDKKQIENEIINKLLLKTDLSNKQIYNLFAEDKKTDIELVKKYEVGFGTRHLQR